MMDYQTLYRNSMENPEEFWAESCRRTGLDETLGQGDR